MLFRSITEWAGEEWVFKESPAISQPEAAAVAPGSHMRGDGVKSEKKVHPKRTLPGTSPSQSPNVSTVDTGGETADEGASTGSGRTEARRLFFTGPSPQCGEAFLDAATAELEALQSPRDCSSARFLVCGSNHKDFEGAGSVIMQTAHGFAEAYYSKRTLIWGPPSAHPHVFRNATCVGRDGAPTYGYSCYFAPLSNCDWQVGG